MLDRESVGPSFFILQKNYTNSNIYILGILFSLINTTTFSDNFDHIFL